MSKVDLGLSKEEIEAQEAKDLAELEDLKSKDDAKGEEIEKKAQALGSEDKDDDKSDDEESSDEESDKDDSADDEEEKKTPVREVVDKEKFVASAREAQVLHSKVKGFEKASEVKDPTEEDMKKEYPEWEDLSDFEQKTAKKNWIQDRRNEAIDSVVAESKNVDEWNKKVDEKIEDPQTLIDEPRLEGKTDDFKIFASKPSRRGVDFEDLIKAFLFDVDENKPAKKKGKMFEDGTGGESKKQKPKNKLSIEEGSKLKERNYEEYKRQLLAGNIEEDF